MLSPVTVNEFAHLTPEAQAHVEQFIHMLAQRTTCCVPSCLHLVPRPAPVKTPAPRDSPARYFTASLGGMITYASPALCRWLERSCEDLIGDTWMTFVNGLDEQKRIAEQWLIAAQTHHRFHHTVRCRTASGAISYAIFLVRPRLHPETHQVIGFVGRVYPQPVLDTQSA
jgi:hypothetical protein